MRLPTGCPKTAEELWTEGQRHPAAAAPPSEPVQGYAATDEHERRPDPALARELAAVAGSGAHRGLHLDMIAAVIDGRGLDRLAELASEAASAPVAIVVPRLGDAVAPGSAAGETDLTRLRSYVRARVAGRPAELPDLVTGET